MSRLIDGSTGEATSHPDPVEIGAQQAFHLPPEILNLPAWVLSWMSWSVLLPLEGSSLTSIRNTRRGFLRGVHLVMDWSLIMSQATGGCLCDCSLRNCWRQLM